MRLRHFLSLFVVLLLHTVHCNDDVYRRVDGPYVADAVGNSLPPPEKLPAKVGSPSNLLTPERYEFYTFDESGELVKRLMTLEEIQEIVAAGDGNDGHLVTLTDNYEPVIAFNLTEASNNKVHNVVTSVQNVLKAQMEAHKNKPPVPPSTFDTPDVSDSWSMILPSIFGNTGMDIVPDKPPNTFGTPETETIEVTKPDIYINTNGDIVLSKEDIVEELKQASTTKTTHGEKESTTKKSTYATKSTESLATKTSTQKIMTTSKPQKISSTTTMKMSSTTPEIAKTTEITTVKTTSTTPKVTSTKISISTTKIPIQSNTEKITTPTTAKISEPPKLLISSSATSLMDKSKSTTTTSKPKSTTQKTIQQTRPAFIPSTVKNYLTSELPTSVSTKAQTLTTIRPKTTQPTKSSISVPKIEISTSSIENHTIHKQTTQSSLVSTSDDKKSTPGSYSPSHQTIKLTEKPLLQHFSSSSNIPQWPSTITPSTTIKWTQNLDTSSQLQQKPTKPSPLLHKIQSTKQTEKPYKTHTSTTTQRPTFSQQIQQSTKQTQKPSYYLPTNKPTQKPNTKKPAISTTVKSTTNISKINLTETILQNDSPLFDMTESMNQIASDLENSNSYEKMKENQTLNTKLPLTGQPVSLSTISHTDFSSHDKTAKMTSTTQRIMTDNIATDTITKKSTMRQPTSPSPSPTTLTKVESSTKPTIATSTESLPLIDLNSILDLSGSMSDLLSQVVDDRPSGIILNGSEITTMDALLERNDDMDIVTTEFPTSIALEQNVKPNISQTKKTNNDQKISENSSTISSNNNNLLDRGTMKVKPVDTLLKESLLTAPILTTKIPNSHGGIKTSSIDSSNSKVTTTTSKTTTKSHSDKIVHKTTKKDDIKITTKSPIKTNSIEPVIPTKIPIRSSTQTYKTTTNKPTSRQPQTTVKVDTSGYVSSIMIPTSTLVPTLEKVVSPSRFSTQETSTMSLLTTEKNNSTSTKKQTNLETKNVPKEEVKQLNGSNLIKNVDTQNQISKKNESNYFVTSNNTKSYENKKPLESLNLVEKLNPTSGIIENDNKVSNYNGTHQYKLNDTKKKIQKVNIDAKEQLENLNVSWKLVPTVTPPRMPSSLNESKTSDKTNELYSDPGKVINLDSSKENQGLEATTKDLTEDLHLFSELCNELAFKYWHSLSDDVDKKRGFVLSPYAITSMLAMLFMGARGATSGEMNEILKLDEMVTFNPHFVLKNISDSIDNAPASGVYASAFVRELFSDRNSGKVLSFYKERAHQFYGGHVEEVNFRLISDVIRRRTNLLVKRHSWGRITEHIKSNNIFAHPPLAAFSVNLFQTDCAGTVTEGRDGEMYFVVSPSVRHRRLVPVPAVLYRSDFLAGYDPVLDATAASIGNGSTIVSIVFVMPGQQGNAVHSNDLEDLEKRLLGSNPTTPAWNRLLRTLLPRMGLELQIPRFSHNSMLNVTTILQKMGMKDIFDPKKADLGGISGPSKVLYISDMLQSNSFTTCGEETIGDQHHSEVYPGDPLRKRKTFKMNEGWDEPRDYQRSFHDPNDLGPAALLPLHLRPRQARVPARSSPSTVARLKFDRPFLYFVRHNPTGMILYIGRYNPRLMP